MRALASWFIERRWLILAQSKELDQIKKSIEDMLGSKVRLKANKGRKKISVKTGIVEHTYPSIFTVRVKDKYDKERTVSYAYTDILIRNVQIMPFDEEPNPQAC